MHIMYRQQQKELNIPDCECNGSDDLETDTTVEKAYYRKNSKNTGYIIFSVSVLIIIAVNFYSKLFY